MEANYTTRAQAVREALSCSQAAGDAQTPQVCARVPAALALRRHVRSLWHYTHANSRSFEYVLPSPRAQLLINLASDELRHWAGPVSVRTRVPGIAIQGALTRRVLIDTDQKRAICGVEFEPGGSTAFHDIPATGFVDTIVDAREVWGNAATALRAKLLGLVEVEHRLDEVEGFLLARMRSRGPEHDLTERATQLLAEGIGVAVVRARLGLSQRAFHELLERRVGLRPKLFARVSRVSSAILAAPGRTSWSDLAYKSGYADQPHLVREFGAFAGTSPAQYRPAREGEALHMRAKAEEIFKTEPDEGSTPSA